MNPRADDETVRPNSLYSSIGNGVKEVEAMGEHIEGHHQAEGVNEVDDQEAITPMIARKPKGPAKPTLTRITRCTQTTENGAHIACMARG